MNKTFIVVHAGRRDDYQVALALHEAGMLKYLVTDFYTPYDSFIGKLFIKNNYLRGILSKRYKIGLPSYKIKLSYKALTYFILFNITKKVKFDNLKGVALGKKANSLSVKYRLPILSMNTYATEAFENNPITPKILFQFHPHPNYVAQILQEEIEINPKSKASIMQEYEFSIPKSELRKLSNEIFLTTEFICASSMTKKSLMFEGVSSERIKVIPYGVDHRKFSFVEREKPNQIFNVLFVGSLNQRKGIIYLLNAISNIEDVSLTIVGRGIFDLSLLEGYRFPIYVYNNVSHGKLLNLFHQSHCFVLPSIVEGFGQVILEAMSTGIPVIATENTAAIDIITNGKDGFVIPIRDSEAIAESIRRLKADTEYARQIGIQAHLTAKEYSWNRFRENIVQHLISL